MKLQPWLWRVGWLCGVALLIAGLVEHEIPAAGQAIGGGYGFRPVSPPGLSPNVSYINPGSSAIINGALLTNAVKFAVAPAEVNIPPGTYMIPTNTLPSVMAKSGIREYYHPGAIVACQTAGGDAAYFFDDQAGAVINFGVYGYGQFFFTNDVGDIFNFTTSGSKVDLEFHSAEAYSQGAIGVVGQGVEMRVAFRDHVKTTNYDTFYGTATSSKFYINSPGAWVEAGQDFIEFTGDFGTWGDSIINVGSVRAGLGQSAATHSMQLAGRQLVTIGRFEAYGNMPISSSPSAQTNAIIQNSVLAAFATNNHCLIGQRSAGDGFTSLLIRNSHLIGASNANIITLSNSAPATIIPLTLENCVLEPGWNSTNLANSKSGLQQLAIVGAFSATRPLGFDTNITILAQKRIVLASSTTPVASAGAAAFTNLQSFILTAAQLTNVNDAIEFTASGAWNNALGGTTQFLWTNTVVGTIFDTGAQTISNGTWTTKLRITRMGASLQLNDVSVSTASIGSAWQGTNRSPMTAQSMGAATVIRLVSQTPNNGQLTNNSWLVEYIPAQ